MRKYPVLAFLDRRCDIDYRIPDTDLIIEKGTAVYISISGIHNDELYYENPKKFNPDRFLGKMTEEDLCYFPFGSGPRACLGEDMKLSKS